MMTERRTYFSPVLGCWLPIADCRFPIFDWKEATAQQRGFQSAIGNWKSAILVVIHPPVLVDGLVEAGDLFGGDDLGAVAFVAGLEAQDGDAGVVLFGEDALEGGLAVDEAVVAVAPRGGGGEDDDVPLAVLGDHAVAVHAGGERVGVVQVRAADVRV